MTTEGQDDASERVPESLIARTKRAFGRPAVPGELAVLIFDSLLDQDDPAANHRLRFEHPRLAIEVHISASTSQSDLTGLVEPPSSLEVHLEQLDGDARRQDAADGRFAFPQIPHGPVRLHLTGAVIPRIHSDWFRV